MRPSDIDWPILRGAAITLAITVLIVGGMVAASSSFESSARAAFEKDQRRFVSASNRYLAVDEEERLTREYLPVYRALEDDGLIGEEQRLDWTESLAAVAEELELPSVRYQVQPQEPYQPPAEIPTGAFRVYASPMRLSVGLVHEEDLFRLLHALEERASGSFNVEGCALRRSDGTEPGPFTENISAECSLKWFTVRKPGPEEGRR